MASKKAKRQFPKTIYLDWAEGTQDEDDYFNTYEDVNEMVNALDDETLATEVIAVYELKYVATVEKKIVLIPKK